MTYYLPGGIIWSMSLNRAVIILILTLIISSCSVSDQTVDVTLTLANSISSATPQPPTDTPFPSQTPTLTLTVAVSTPMDSATPEPAWQLCSPLAEQTLWEIPEIVSDPYNPPPPGKDDRHHGTDLAYYRRKERTTIEGEVVQAVLPGKVVAVVEDQLPYGNMVMIETKRPDLPSSLITELRIAPNESLYHLYAHFRSNPFVDMGQWVECGQALGEVGATGYNIVNAHLHLETRLGPTAADFSDGMAYYDTRTTEEERANYELWRTSGEFRHFDPMGLIEFFLENWVEE
jgi:murein DD-endopeptidase MepM/ murein hydrolase activator NlpD